MAKLSVYNTIDRSQLGGKFVPLIQSGVSNYKILASDLGKEYHPGDAIEITDTGEINVKFNSNDFDVSSEGLTIKTDAARGVFKGSDGVYIASANDSIGISLDGIKVNTSVLAGYGLESKYNNTLYVKSADSTISVNGDGISVYYGSGLRLDDQGRLSLHNDYLSQYATVRAGHGLYWYHPGYPESALYVKSANNSILVGEYGLSVHAYALIDKTYLSITQRHVITVDKASVARAITGSGLVTTNGAIGVNVNTATGIVVNDNKLYLNAGNGLQTTNNTVNVKAADRTINVSHAGIKVNTGPGLETMPIGLSVKSVDGSIFVNDSGIGVDLRNARYVGSGLTNSIGELAVKAANNSIGVSSAGIKVNTYYLAGHGLSSYHGTLLYIHSADEFIKVVSTGVGLHYQNLISSLANSYGGSSNIKIAYNYLYTAIGDGLRWGSNSAIYVRSADNTINVNGGGISVNPGYGLETTSSGLYVKSADNTINVSSSGISVNTVDLAGSGLGGADGLYVMSANGTIGVSSSGIGVNVTSGGGLLTGTDGLYIDSGKIAGRGLTAHTEQHNVKLNVNVGLYDLSSNNNSSNLLKLDTATNALYVGGVDITGIIGTNNTMTRQQDPTSHYHSFGVDVDYLFSTYTDRATLVYSGNKLSVHLSSIAGENIGYNPTSKSLYVSSGGSGGSIVGVDVDTPNGYGTQASEGGVAIGESAHANGGNSVAVGRLSNAHGTQSVAIGYFSSAGNFKSIAIGNSAVSTGHSSISIGAASSAHYDRGIAVGQEAAVYEEGGISIGGFSGAGSGISIGLGSYTQSGIAVGSEADAGGSSSIAIGNHAYVNSASLGGIAIGYGAQAFTASNLAIGYQAQAHSFATVLGSFATAGAMSVCSGYKASATNECSVVIGAGSVSSNQYALSAGYDSSANGEMSVAVGTHSIAAGYGCLALGAFSNSSTYGGVSIGYKSRSLGGIAIGYESSASDGMMSLTVYHSSGRRFNYSYGCDGYLYSMYSNSTSSGTYTRSWDNLLTPPNYSTAVSINTNTEYTADRPAYIAFNVYAGGTSGYVVEFIKNSVTVFNVGVLYGLTVYNIIPVSKGDKYKLNITDYGATNPAVYAYRIYPS